MQRKINRLMIDNADYSVEQADFLVLGVPFYSTCGVKGNGPLAIRQSLNSLSSFNMNTGRDLFDVLKIRDHGDINASNYKMLETKISKSLKNIYSNGFKGSFIFLGGEHLVTLPLVKGLMGKERFNYLVLDAHADFYDKYLSKKQSYATVTRRVSELVNKVYVAGVRDLTLTESKSLINNSNVKLINMNEIPKLLSNGKWYISIDLDILDPIYCPNVSTPVPIGLTLKELVNLLNDTCFNSGVIAIDFVELTSRSKDLSAVNTAGLIIKYLESREVSK